MKVKTPLNGYGFPAIGYDTHLLPKRFTGGTVCGLQLGMPGISTEDFFTTDRNEVTCPECKGGKK